MRKITPILMFPIVCLLVVSCFTPRAYFSKKVSEPSKPIENYILLYSVLHDDLLDLGEQNYNTYLKGKFNNLEDKGFRDNLVEKYLKLKENETPWDYRLIFEDFRAYDYAEFKNQLQKREIGFVLLVTQKSFVQNEELSAIIKHQVYLFELGKDEPIWVSYGFTKNASTGKFAKGILASLKEEGLL